MKIIFSLAVLLSSGLFAQTESKVETRTFSVSGGFGQLGPVTQPIQGAPYSATMNTESVQTLADGNRIVQQTSALTARDSQGRTRNEVVLPMIGNMSAVKAPHLVMINDPVAQTSYNLNLDDKTAHKMPGLPLAMPATMARLGNISTASAGVAGPVSVSGDFSSVLRLPSEQGPSHKEDLGIQTMEGASVQGVRITRTIAAGEIGNEKPIDIVEEIWTSPDLKTVVYSKRTDPRSGEQTLRLTNIVRAEPDPSLFTVPSDFKLVDVGQGGSNTVFYRPNE